MRPLFARLAAGLARSFGRRSPTATPSPSSTASEAPRGAPLDGRTLAEMLGLLVATLLFVGAPALLLAAELRDPACAEQLEVSQSPFRVLAVQDHHLVRCLGERAAPQASAEAKLASADSPSTSLARALADPAW